MATATITGTEFTTPSASRGDDYGRASWSLREVRPPVTSYSLSPREAGEACETNVSNPDGWGRRDDAAALTVT